MKKIQTLPLYILGIICLLTGCKETCTPDKIEPCLPPVFPDYTGVTIPATLAPLNFTLNTNYSKIDARLKGTISGEIHLQAQKHIHIPEKRWKELLKANQGSTIAITVSVKENGQWIQYQEFPIHISPHPIDYGLVYRLIAPGYEMYSKMGIYQRDLSDFTEKPLIENTSLSGNCVNCHSFCAGNPEQMSLHIRGEHGGTLLLDKQATNLYQTKTDKTLSSCVYPYWHPSGEYIAYSVNQTQQMFHEIKNERVEVVDHQSDLVIYHLKTNQLITCPFIQSDAAFETFPAFSPDGKTLYFCSAKARSVPAEYKEVQYSLCSIPFDPENGTFGEKVDTLISAPEWNKSVSFPRPSPDGKYILYTWSDYGNFSIWHKESDLWLLHVGTNELRELTEVNSPDVDSYHSWSSNSRWFVFSSRRMDGLYTRPYIASIGTDGTITKPFLLPQKDPEYYQTSLYSFNIPEFIKEPVRLDAREVQKKALSKERIQMQTR